MTEPIIKALVFCAVNAGGDGKSTLADMFIAMAVLLDLKIGTVDADEGNGALTATVGDADKLVWGAPVEIGLEILEYHRNADLILVDIGGNGLTPRTALSDVVRNMCEYAVSLGRKPFIFVPIGTNKPGSGQGADHVISYFQDFATTLLVRNDRDGSGNFEETAAEPTVFLQHLQSGFMAVRKDRPKTPLQDVIFDPTPGFELASGQLGQWLNQLAMNRHVAEIFGIGSHGIPALKALKAPGPLLFRVKTKFDASDVRLELNNQCCAAHNDWLWRDRAEPGFIERAARLHDLHRRYHSEG